jgi:hypothetical protein
VNEARLYDSSGGDQIGTVLVPAGPSCDDTCDACGECLHCIPECTYDVDGVWDGPRERPHFWVVYADQLDGFIAAHQGAEMKP